MHPVLFRLGPSIPIFSFGVALLVAVSAAAFYCVLVARKERVPAGLLAVCLVVGAYAGAKGLSYVEDFLSKGLLLEGLGGMRDYGALLGAALAMGALTVLKRLPFGVQGDIVAPAAALALGISRVGCYMFGCDHGVLMGPSMPAALAALGTFPKWPPGTLHPGNYVEGSPAFSLQVHRHLLNLDAPAALPVHPTQLYLLIGSLSLFAVLLQLRESRAFQGQLLVVFTLAYGALRFLVDFVLDEEHRTMLGPLSFVQWIALLSMAAILIAWPYFKSHPAWVPVVTPPRKAPEPRIAGDDENENRPKPAKKTRKRRKTDS